MFRHWLVTLDGSALAETVLPTTALLAERLGAAVTLIHVIERKAPTVVHGDRHLTGVGEAEAYLADVARRAFGPRLKVGWHVHAEQVEGVAQSIADHAAELGNDLIVMSTHGRGGLRHRLFGSIAQRVVRLGLPVLLVPPAPAGGPRPFECRRIMVPLSGTAEHEEALPVAAELARACGAALDLLVVVPTLGTLSGERVTTSTLLPGATAELLDLEEGNAARYLHAHAARLEAQGIRVAAEVARGDPASIILTRAREREADFIVVGTHGKVGMDAFWSGSVAPRLSVRAEIPMLLVPAAGDGAGAGDGAEAAGKGER